MLLFQDEKETPAYEQFLQYVWNFQKCNLGGMSQCEPAIHKIWKSNRDIRIESCQSQRGTGTKDKSGNPSDAPHSLK